MAVTPGAGRTRTKTIPSTKDFLSTTGIYGSTVARPKPAPKGTIRRSGGGTPKPSGGTVKPKPKPKPKPVVKPKPMSLADWLAGDMTYQQQKRRFGKIFADFMAELQRQRGDISLDYGVAQRAGQQQRTKDLRDILYGFAGRGLLRSGLHARERGEYEEEFGERMSELERQRSRSLAGLSAEESKFKGEQTLAKQEAREEAARRRAEKYNLV